MALRHEEPTRLSDHVDLERDGALVERCQAGDSTAFGNLYARYYDRIFRYCLRRLNDRHEAEDAAQEAFARAWKALPQFAGERRFYPWLTVIAGNICTDVLRRRARSTTTDDLSVVAQQLDSAFGASTSEDVVLAAVDGELVNRALHRLSPRHRHVIAMREGSGWTYQQIAAHEGVGVGTVESLLWRARQALRREFALLSEGKEALAGFLVAGALFVRRVLHRVAHRGAGLQSQSSNVEGLRGAVAGVAVAGAAIGVTVVTPLALSSSTANGPSHPPVTRAAAGTSVAGARTPVAVERRKGAVTGGTVVSGNTPTGSDTGSSPGSSDATGSGQSTGAAGPSPTYLGGGTGTAGGPGDALGASGSPTTGTGNPGTNLANGIGSTVGGLGNVVAGSTGAVGDVVGGAAGNLTQTVNGAVGGLAGVASGVVGGVTGTLAPSSSSSGTPIAGAAGQTTTTSPPGLLGGLTQTATHTVNGLLGG